MTKACGVSDCDRNAEYWATIEGKNLRRSFVIDVCERHVRELDLEAVKAS